MFESRCQVIVHSLDDKMGRLWAEIKSIGFYSWPTMMEP